MIAQFYEETTVEGTLTEEEMIDYGYRWDGMMPLTEEKAYELFEKNECSIYLLYEDGTENLANSIEEIEDHLNQGGMVGAEKEFLIFNI
jgi:hypothetical protein